MGSVSDGVPRDVWTSIKRGFFCRCPNCGKGKLFNRFLKVEDRCEVCDEAFHHHRADDLPAYIVIAVVGHVVVSGVLWAADHSTSPIWLQLLVLGAATVILSLALLQPVKGAVIGLQWANRMHGFGGSSDDSIHRAPDRSEDQI